MTLETTEVRKMDAALKFELVNLLDINDGWKSLMASVTVDCDPNKSPKYTFDHLKLIEMASQTQRRSCSEIFLEEWGTSGHIRPNLKILMDMLFKLKLVRAAECVASKIMNDKPIDRLATSMDFLDIDEYTDNDNSENCKSTLFAHQLETRSTKNDDKSNGRFDKIKLPYKYLSNATNGFSDSCLIGAGGFGKVFKAKLTNQIVAIKLMDKIFEEKDFKQYLNEIDIVLKFKHDNILPLLAISCDEQPCVIYEFMENGSLLDCLACKNRSSILDWKLRIKIGTDVASGLVYLHTAFETPFIHRDIKTANILLDNKFIAKIGDFGLTRIGDHTMTSVVLGTSAYMSPEAFRGDISMKIDVFSFGVVLLELITGLAPYDECRTGCDLLTHISEIECPIEELLDKRAGYWNNSIARKIYDLAILCTAAKTQRPFMHGQEGVFESLKNIQSEIDI
ncbi:interleukin-1 receptor-associated kinase 4-like [Myzus persicae]|uniref:interleukin-1 receptor-associated kinase 4-like n=1 Tax=Myzus persicae TaxID=13164 RepID=UPI000B930AA2|nr:interleukin-1 receptor-associated kinase 4-like [Myzus persicae]XP_022170968.1 interleukin-1 receptor-associated kinase 4-like [Myzus persicae]